MKADDFVFPYATENGYFQNGLTARDYIAIHAPITYEDVAALLVRKEEVKKFGDRKPESIDDKLKLLNEKMETQVNIPFEQIFNQLVFMRYEYADAMIKQSENDDG